MASVGVVGSRSEETEQQTSPFTGRGKTLGLRLAYEPAER
ncbi:hypothetical protein THTE_4014 [Thermogutta terrifontis]|uniref:Uncharacterized protein n=1 Tax=Thermogutta terrifontis TaxID=1331910 RepID=A0A286RKW3_9BACT|nr:hypothetical protein THTE_4014 [Thermogutta terrifontis]